MIAAANNINFVQPVNYLSPLTRGLVGFYTPGTGFDGGSTLYDLTRLRSHAAFSGSPVWTSVAPVDGKRSLLYSGLSQFLTGPTGRPNVQEHSLFAWIRPTLTTQQRIIASQADSIVAGGVEWACSVGGSARLGMAYWDGTNVRGFYTSAIGTVTLNVWQFAGIVWKPGTISFYRDGEFLSSSATTTSAISYANDTFLIGNQVQNQDFAGYMSDFLLYDRALSSGEARDLYRESLANYPRMLNRITSPALLTPQSSGFPFIQYYAGSGVSL